MSRDLENTLNERISKLEQRLQILEDIEAVKRLQRAYGYYLDKGLWDEIVDLFTEDGSAEIAARGVFIGRESIGRLMRDIMGRGVDGLPHGRLLNHFQLQGIVTMADDGKTAKARWRAFIQSAVFGESALWAEGPYEMEYRRDEDGIWRIARLVWFATYYTSFEEGWAKDARPRNTIDPAVPPDAPPTFDYETYPSYFVPPFHYANPGRKRG